MHNINLKGKYDIAYNIPHFLVGSLGKYFTSLSIHHN